MKKEDIEKVFDENSTTEDHLIALKQLLKGFTQSILQSLDQFEQQIGLVKKAVQETNKLVSMKSAREMEDYVDDYMKEKNITVKSHAFTITPDNKDEVLQKIVDVIRKDIKGKTIGEIEKEINKKKH